MPYSSPQSAFDTLLEGNDRFVLGTPAHPNQDSRRRQSLAGSQAPFATLFGCSDSRVAAELIFDVGLGDMFVVRTAGQVADTAVLGTLEYGTAVLGTPLLVVLGHDSCGAVIAAKENFDSGVPPGGFITDVVARITPSVVSAERNGIHEIDDIVAEHVRLTCLRIAERSVMIQRRIDDGTLAIAGLTYSLAIGHARVVATHGNLTVPDAARLTAPPKEQP